MLPTYKGVDMKIHLTFLDEWYTVISKKILLFLALLAENINEKWVLELFRKAIEQGISIAMVTIVISYFLNQFIKNVHINLTIKNITQAHLKEQKNYQRIEYVFGDGDTELKEFSEQLINSGRKSGWATSNILLYGPAGIGKTSFVRWLSQQTKAALYEVAKISHLYAEKGLPDTNMLHHVISHAKANIKKERITLILLDDFDVLCKSEQFVRQFLTEVGEELLPRGIILVATTTQDPINLDEKIQQRFEKLILIRNSLKKSIDCFQLYLKSYHRKELPKDQLQLALKNYTYEIEETIGQTKKLLDKSEKVRLTICSAQYVLDHNSVQNVAEITKFCQLHDILQKTTMDVEKMFIALFDLDKKTLLIPPRIIVNITKIIDPVSHILSSHEVVDKALFLGKLKQMRTSCLQLQASDLLKQQLALHHSSLMNQVKAQEKQL